MRTPLQNRLWAGARAVFRVAVSTPCMTASTEMTCCGRRGSGCEPTVAPPASDKVTVTAVEEYGVHRLLGEVAADLRAGRYRPAPVRRVEIPKPDGRMRPLGIPIVRDRVVQAATKLVLEPIFEADFLPCSFGFRPKRSATDAAEAIRVSFPQGRQFVFEADIRDFFGSIDHDRLLALLAERVSDRRVLKLVRDGSCGGVGRWGADRDGHRHTSGWGDLPAAGEHLPARLRQGLGRVRHRRAGPLHGRLRGVVHDPQPSRTSPAAGHRHHGRTRSGTASGQDRVVDLRGGREGFDFLGWHFHARMSGRLWEQQRIVRYYLHRWPSLRSMKRTGAKSQGASPIAARSGMELKVVIGRLNLFLRGWGNYFRTGNVPPQVPSTWTVTWRGGSLASRQEARPQPACRSSQPLNRKSGSTTKVCTSCIGTNRYPKAA